MLPVREAHVGHEPRVAADDVEVEHLARLAAGQRGAGFIAPSRCARIQVDLVALRRGRQRGERLGRALQDAELRVLRSWMPSRSSGVQARFPSGCGVSGDGEPGFGTTA